MARTKIAEVRLVAGQGNFFDELTRIHLTMGNPIGEIYSGMNLTNIRRAIKAGRLFLVRGSLGPDPSPYRLVKENGKYKLSVQKPKMKDTDVKVTKPTKEVEPKSEVKNSVEPKVETPTATEAEFKKNTFETSLDTETTLEVIQELSPETEKVFDENKSEKKKKRHKKENAEAES